MVAALALALLALAGCASLPSLDERTPSTVLRDTAGTRLGRAVAELTQAHPGRSGVFALPSGRDAFAARVLLAGAAERAIDVQYYIWHADMSGTLLLDALRRAAERGVRVRVLLDDNNTGGRDAAIAAVAALPNVEVRLFNPFAVRGLRAFDLLGDFARLNRRMHNKSFTVDNQATIVGGRNVGDEYFDAGGDFGFVDLDVLAIGPAVSDVSEDFDRYWASASSYPALALLPAPALPASLALERRLQAIEHEPVAQAYRQTIAASSFVEDMRARRLPLEWTDVHLVSDDPSKGLGQAADDDLMWARLKRIVARPRSELVLSSPYFVPGEAGVADFGAMAAGGVRVTVLTNSLEATDVPAVHAGYAKRRVALLRAGIALFEVKRASSRRHEAGSGHLLAGSGSSASSLHAKTFEVDGRHVFIGSFNFDPRSARLNTEMGFVIDSPTLAQGMADSVAREAAEGAYRVRLDPAGNLQWVEIVDDREIVHDEEPGTTFWQRLGVSVLSWLPIEWLL